MFLSEVCLDYVIFPPTNFCLSMSPEFYFFLLTFEFSPHTDVIHIELIICFSSSL